MGKPPENKFANSHAEYAFKLLRNKG